MTPTDRKIERAERRILMVAPHPCFECRGSPINVGLMCRALGEAGYHIDLVTYPFGAHIPLPNVHYHRVARPPGLRSVGIGFSYAKLPLDFLLMLRTAELLATRRYIAVHAVEEAAFFATPLARFFRTPAITDLDSDLHDQLVNHKSAVARMLAPLVRPIMRMTLRSSKAAVTVCGALTYLVAQMNRETRAFQIEDIPPPQVTRLPCADRTRDLKHELGLNGQRVVVYTGNLEGYQGVEILVDAIPLVARHYPDVAFVIVGGEDAHVRRLREYADRNGVNGLLHLPGKRPQEDMPEYLGMADVLVSPRCQGTNTPLKIYTYMQSGRPIVATDLPTHTQVLDTSTAILTQPTAEEFAEGLLTALRDQETASARAAAAHQRVSERYNFDVFRAKLAAVYDYVAG